MDELLALVERRWIARQYQTEARGQTIVDWADACSAAKGPDSPTSEVGKMVVQSMTCCSAMARAGARVPDGGLRV